MIIENGPAGALVTMSSQVDVLVCGSRGYGPVKTVLLGSVSQVLSRHARCPLIVLPRGSERALDELVGPQGRRPRHGSRRDRDSSS